MKRARLIGCLALAFVLLAGSVIAQDIARGQDPAERLLHQALDRARATGSYQVDVSLDQTVGQDQPLFFGAPEERVHFEIEGSVAGPDRVRLSILPGRTSISQAQEEPQELLVRDSTVYCRAGDRWVQTSSNPPPVEVDGLGLSLLSVARDVELVERVTGPAAPGEQSPSFQRVGFRLYADDVTRFLVL